jgi:prepilin-type processing-associated H-X9-DG protein
MKPSNRSGLTQLELLVALTIIALLVALIVPAVQSARESSRRVQCAAHLGSFGLSLQEYEAAQRRYVASVQERQPGPTFLYAPHVHLLPYFDQLPLFSQIDLNRPVGLGWNPSEDYPILVPYADTRIAAFLCPSDGHELGTNYRLCTGADIDQLGGDGAISGMRGWPTGRFTDGLSHTAAASERIKSDLSDRWDASTDYWNTGLSAWPGGPTDREELIEICGLLTGAPPSYYPFVGHTWLLTGYDFTLYNHAVGPNAPIPDCSTNNGPPNNVPVPLWTASLVGVHKASSRHSSGVNLVFMDGHVQFVSDSVDLEVWRGWATRSGDEVVPSGL